MHYYKQQLGFLLHEILLSIPSSYTYRFAHDLATGKYILASDFCK